TLVYCDTKLVLLLEYELIEIVCRQEIKQTVILLKEENTALISELEKYLAIADHFKSKSLQQQIEEFQIIYQFNIETISINDQVEQDTYNSEEFNEFDTSSNFILKEFTLEESILDEPILNNEQINKFKRIYSKNKIENIEDNNNLIQNIKENLDKKDKEAQYKKLQTMICSTIKESQKHNRLDNKYIFEEIEIY
ncbi:42891_t:CDS:2, partial [Gigaspora margarita]